MGMALALHTISDENIDRVLADPPLIWRVIAPDDPEIYQDARSEKPRGFLARIFGSKGKEPETELPELPSADGEGKYTDLDKAWHGIHYLLTGTDWSGEEPMNFIVCGGTEVGDIDTGYGPARVIRSEKLREIADTLSAIDGATLRERFNPTEMMKLKIYPEIWERDPKEDDALSYCVEYYEDLRRFLGQAAKDSMGVTLYIC